MFSLLFALTVSEKVAVIINNEKEYTGDNLTAILNDAAITNVYQINASGNIYFKELKHEKLENLIVLIVGNMAETDIPEGFFKGTILNTVIFSKAQRIGIDAFSGCTKLKTAIFPEAIQISKNAFAGCSSLDNVSIPNAISIEDAAFSGSGIKNVTFQNALIIYSSVFSNCNSLVEVSLPNCSCVIQDKQFFNCPNLQVIRLPVVKFLYFNNTQFIQSSPNLTSLYFPANPPEGVEDQTFNVSAANFSIVLPSEKDWKNYIPESNTNGDYEIVYKGYNSHVIDSAKKFRRRVLPYLIIAIIVVVIGVGVGLFFFFYKRGSLDSILPNSRLV